MTLKIYGVLRSRATRVVWMAKELGLAYEHIPVIQHYRLADATAPDAPFNTKSPAFRAVNPNGLVPTIDDDGFVLHESLAITFYLARKHGGPLAPADVREEGLMLMWTLQAATEIEAAALRALQNGAAAKSRDEAVYAAAITALKPKIAVLDKALGNDAYLVGGRFTVADLNVAEVVRYAQGAPEVFASAPNVKKWIETCQARPAFKAMWAERDAEPA